MKTTDSKLAELLTLDELKPDAAAILADPTARPPSPPAEPAIELIRPTPGPAKSAGRDRSWIAAQGRLRPVQGPVRGDRPPRPRPRPVPGLAARRRHRQDVRRPRSGHRPVRRPAGRRRSASRSPPTRRFASSTSSCSRRSTTCGTKSPRTCTTGSARHGTNYRPGRSRSSAAPRRSPCCSSLHAGQPVLRLGVQPDPRPAGRRRPRGRGRLHPADRAASPATRWRTWPPRSTT